MAAYIDDKKVIEVALTQEGVNLIVDKLNSYNNGYSGTEWHFESKKGETYFDKSVSIRLHQGDNYNTVVGISKDQIYINPISVKIAKLGKIEDVSIMKELKFFIESEMISIIRNRKLDEIL